MIVVGQGSDQKYQTDMHEEWMKPEVRGLVGTHAQPTRRFYCVSDIVIKFKTMDNDEQDPGDARWQLRLSFITKIDQ